MYIAKSDIFQCTGNEPGPSCTADGFPLSLDVPAGTYLVTGKLYMTSAAYGGCYLDVGGTLYNHAFYDNNANAFAAVMVDKITLADAGTIRIRCGNGFADPWTTISIVLTAQPITP